jgi:hypothetical protein
MSSKKLLAISVSKLMRIASERLNKIWTPSIRNCLRCAKKVKSNKETLMIGEIR